tara:strand:- start:606 stop:737 length:132 start_codon:yes stop_codon:yes gene_type:complete
MCGAISTRCITDGCDGWTRYDIHCVKCIDIRLPQKRIFLRRGE